MVGGIEGLNQQEMEENLLEKQQEELENNNEEEVDIMGGEGPPLVFPTSLIYFSLEDWEWREEDEEMGLNGGEGLPIRFGHCATTHPSPQANENDNQENHQVVVLFGGVDVVQDWNDLRFIK